MDRRCDDCPPGRRGGGAAPAHGAGLYNAQRAAGDGRDRATGGRRRRASRRPAGEPTRTGVAPAARARRVRLMSIDRAPIRVATYNVHACVGADGRHDPDRVANVIGELNADIVALQEFTYPATVALETRSPVVLTTLDRYECALGPTRQSLTHCFGTALFPRHPIVEIHRIALSMQRREPRGALAATVDVGGALIHRCADHMGLRVSEGRFHGRALLDY